ncbi:hypothetical protein BP6252_14090 [Coleophoma cylindrospora]|uniref:Acetyl-CoA synthetase-like protein n=1 Tax=Coleophoma cylindrospora TaxID=1849047 RepID=A0A3D8Q402_9HELO|nr:hypothetical protein BP6252_14090 [Coleophoma cylindrospora]
MEALPPSSTNGNDHSAKCIVHSRSIEVPPVDLLTYAFEREREFDQGRKLYIDAEDVTLALTGPQVINNVKQLIAGLKAAGVAKGDSVFYTCLYFAIIGSGAVYTGANPGHTVFELTHFFSLCETRVVITVPDYLEAAKEACQALPNSNIKIFVLDEAAQSELLKSRGELDAAILPPTAVEDVVAPLSCAGSPSVTSLLSHGFSDWMRINNEQTARDTTACMFPTSGTTGLPKLCRLSHYSEVAKDIAIQSEGKDYEVKTLMTLPLFHIFGAALVHINPLRRGEPVYILPRFDLKKFANAIQEHSITDTATTPLIVLNMLKSGLPLSDLLSSLRFIWCGSSPIDAAVLNKFYEVLSPRAIVTGLWGMSEIGGLTFFKFPERDTTGSVGRLSPGATIKLIDDMGNIITTENTPGEAWARSPQVMASYYKNTVATSDMIQDGWLCTGDICYVSSGKWYVIGRKKELIKVSGWQVAPAELEAVLLSHPKIMDAAVLGVKTVDNEMPRAFVVRMPTVGDADSEGGLGEAEVRTFMGERLAKYKSLHGGIVFLDAIPKNDMGKTQKTKLIEMYQYVA